jgi:peptide/nickel transport system substrate-binding protein
MWEVHLIAHFHLLLLIEIKKMIFPGAPAPSQASTVGKPVRAGAPTVSPQRIKTFMYERFSSCLFSLLVIALLFATACRQTTVTSGLESKRERVIGRRGGEIRVRLTALPKTFNPLLVADEPSLLVNLYLLHSRLVDFNHDTQNWTPALAEQWQVESDGKTFSIRLREAAQFSDGQALTAEDVVFTLRALYDERTGSPLLRDALLINGKPIEAVAIDAKTLRLTFPEKVAAPESYLMNLPVLPRHELTEAFQQGTLSTAWGLNESPDRIVTTGPFVLEALQPGASLQLKRNPYYWKQDQAGTPLPYLDKIAIQAIGDANNTLLRLTQGTLDLADRIRASDFATLQSSPGVVRAVDVGPGLSTDYFWFNLQNGKGNPRKQAWFNEVRFRRALAHAVDRDTIARTTLRGLATPLYGFVSPGNRAWIANDLPRTNYDLKRALALLQEGGFELRGSELHDRQGHRVEFTLLVQAENEPRKQMAAVIQQDLAQLGINLQVAPLDTQALMERWQKTFDYDAILMGLTVTDTEPSSYSGFLLSNAALHQWSPQQATPATAWEQRINELVVAQAREANLSQRQAQFREIQQLMAEQMPIIPIVSRHIVSAAHKRLGNYRPSNIFPFSCWNIEELFIIAEAG